MAEDLLKSKKLESIFLDYENNKEILEDYKQFHNHPTLPIVLSNDLISGYTRKVGGYTDLLDYLE
jgi:hypothetical protein